MSEKVSPDCATCPRRSILSKSAAKLGVIASRKDCPGSNVVDRIRLTAHESGSDGLGVRSKLIEAELTRRKYVCHDAVVTNSPGEVMSKTVTDSDGRRWMRFLTADLDVATLYFAFGSLDDDPNNLMINYEEYPASGSVGHKERE